jgi:hypothetical protein
MPKEYINPTFMAIGVPRFRCNRAAIGPIGQDSNVNWLLGGASANDPWRICPTPHAAAADKLRK